MSFHSQGTWLHKDIDANKELIAGEPECFTDKPLKAISLVRFSKTARHRDAQFRTMAFVWTCFYNNPLSRISILSMRHAPVLRTETQSQGFRKSVS